MRPKTTSPPSRCKVWPIAEETSTPRNGTLAPFKRRSAPVLALAALLLGVAMGPWAVPLLIVAALLLTGRYVGEAVLLAVHRALAPRVRAAKVLWARRHTVALVSLLERAPRSGRGPPALAA